MMRSIITATVVVALAIVAFLAIQELPQRSEFKSSVSTPNAKPQPGTSSPQPAPPSASGGSFPERALQIRTSKAPWSHYQERYKSGDYAWLVSNARATPQAGSYTFGVKALRECQTLLMRGTEENQLREIERSMAPDSSTRSLQIRALRAMFSKCSNLGSLETVTRELNDLRGEFPRVGDAVEATYREGMRLSDPNLPREQRQRRVAELLALDDAIATSAVKSALMARGASINGETITSTLDATAYQAAWDLTMCAKYGDCAGPDSMVGHENCLYRSDCEYLDTWKLVERWLPFPMFDRMNHFYSLINANIEQRNFSRFGLKE